MRDPVEIFLQVVSGICGNEKPTPEMMRRVWFVLSTLKPLEAVSLMEMLSAGILTIVTVEAPPDWAPRKRWVWGYLKKQVQEAMVLSPQISV